MGATAKKSDNRLFRAAELQMVSATRSPAAAELSATELKTLLRRLRQAHDRAKDIGARQQREMRGKAAPRGTRRVRDNTGTKAKAQALADAMQRVDKELSRREQAKKKPTQAELSRRALEKKLQNQTKKPYPDVGRSASAGMRPKQRKKPVKIGTSRKEIGRVSQANKVAQARKDARTKAR